MIIPQQYIRVSPTPRWTPSLILSLTSTFQANNLRARKAGTGSAAGGLAASNSSNPAWVIGVAVAAAVTFLIVALAVLYRKGYLHRWFGKEKKPRPANASRKNKRPRRNEGEMPWSWDGLRLSAPRPALMKGTRRQRDGPGRDWGREMSKV
ncbi:hypothetical protein HJFPF1_08103 [Paramyrothecium foliicola]|nr:hypothetical protein HJFPF1_08103 [Paramyrothecium foliicola]